MCEIVVKIGGSLLDDVARLDETLEGLVALGRRRSLLVVPGGGAFADSVRAVDRRIGIPDDAAHWMAVLAMDQYAHLLAARLAHAEVAFSIDEARSAHARNRIPVLAPYRWLAAADPLPHTWDVTSDSIAAWIAGACGATELILIKAAGATGNLVDPCFDSVRPPKVGVAIVPAERARVVFDQIAEAESPERGTVPGAV